MRSSDVNKMLRLGEKAVAMARKIVAAADDLGMEPAKRRKRRAKSEEPKPKKQRATKAKPGPSDAREES